MQEPWTTLWDKLETCASIGPKPWEAKDPMEVLKYWGEFVQTPQTYSKEQLIHTEHMVGYLLFAVGKNIDFEKQLVKQDKDMLQKQAFVVAAAALQSEISVS